MLDKGESVHTFVFFHFSPVPDDLTPEEQQELENIRRRKLELLEDIQVDIRVQNIKLYTNST